MIPSVINDLIKSGKESVHVLYSNAPWFGVTYKEDRPYVVDQIQKLINNDFVWAAANKTRIVNEWKKRYDGKTETKR